MISFWQCLDISVEWHDDFGDMNLRFEGGSLHVSSSKQTAEDLIGDVSNLLLHVFRFRVTSLTRFNGVGVPGRALMAARWLGIDGLVGMTRASPNTSDFNLLVSRVSEAQTVEQVEACGALVILYPVTEHVCVGTASFSAWCRWVHGTVSPKPRAVCLLHNGFVRCEAVALALGIDNISDCLVPLGEHDSDDGWDEACSGKSDFVSSVGTRSRCSSQ